jgi:beta-phosphoglucomutase-like phosphatase (HAD superfamily)
MITAFDVVKGKPDPEPYLKAWERSGLSKEQCVVIENAPLGVKSGKAAGLTVYAVNTGVLSKEDLKLAGADMVFDTMQQLLAYLQMEN